MPDETDLPSQVSEWFAIAWRFRDDSSTGRVVRFVGPRMVAAGLLSVLPAIGLAWALGFSTGAVVVTLVGLLVLAFVAVGIYAGQRLALRRPATA